MTLLMQDFCLIFMLADFGKVCLFSIVIIYSHSMQKTLWAKKAIDAKVEVKTRNCEESLGSNGGVKTCL